MQIVTFILFGLVLLSGWHPLSAAENQERDQRLVDLRGYWKFEIGDYPAWAAADFDDSQWADIFVPSNWEDEGFPGYDGFAWYRRRFTLQVESRESRYYLVLGRIDDVDEVYLNGRLIGFKGKFPPHPETAYYAYRKYLVPAEYLNFDGENVVAVRVFDVGSAGGIVEGRPGLYEIPEPYVPRVPLAGVWKFQPGDAEAWKDPGYSDEDWPQILVPGNWEVQGFRELNGFAWYRKHFYWPREFDPEGLVLVLGKIDDLDETYLNGHRVGHTGRLGPFGPRVQGDEWQEVRMYDIPPGILKSGTTNVIAVRVFDGLVDGGIFEGPVGIFTREALQDWRRTQKPSHKFWEFFDAIIKGK